MRAFIEEIAREAGRRAMAGYENLTDDDIHAKNNPADLVTTIDRAVEAYIVGAIRDRHPDHGILGEESGAAAGRGAGQDARWVIDPIDGTTNFIHGMPFYSVSIAFQSGGKTLAGAVYAPRLAEFFYAEAGGGATLNGRPLRVSACRDMEKALLATGFACVRARLRPDNFRYLPAIARAAQGINRCGSAALDLAYVAAGRFDGFWELRLEPYDVAAGVLILQEAGGRVSDLAGGDAYPHNSIVATNGLLHDRLLSFFR